MRICSLLPGATEIVFSLGLGDSVVAVSHECDYPPEAKTKTIVVRSPIDPATPSSEIDAKVSGQLREKKSLYILDFEKLQRLAPNLILTQGLCEVCAIAYDDVISAAAALDPSPEIVSLSPGCLHDLFRDIEQVGKSTGSTEAATDLLAALGRRLREVATASAGRTQNRPRVACLEWLSPLYAAGHWIPEMVELAGGEDILAKKREPSRKVSWDRVKMLDPEILVVMPCGFDITRTLSEMHLLRRLKGWKDLSAVRNDQVFAVDAHAYFSRPGPRLLDGLEILARIIRPDVFPWDITPKMAQRLA